VAKRLLPVRLVAQLPGRVSKRLAPLVETVHGERPQHPARVAPPCRKARPVPQVLRFRLRIPLKIIFSPEYCPEIELLCTPKAHRDFRIVRDFLAYIHNCVNSPHVSCACQYISTSFRASRSFIVGCDPVACRARRPARLKVGDDSSSIGCLRLDTQSTQIHLKKITEAL